MTSPTNLPFIEEIPIVEIEIGSELVNLGKLVEKELTEDGFMLVILISNLKHVFRFEKDRNLYIMVSDKLI